MTEQWLLQDINKLMLHRNRVVILDPMNQCGFILPILEQNGFNILRTDGKITEHWRQQQEELFLRQAAETSLKDRQIIFFITRSQDKLTFLFDYCFTYGCLDLSHPQDWIRKKMFSNTGLQVQLENSLLLTAAKLSIGKNLTWWKKIVQDLEDMIDLEEELLPFVHNPDEFLDKKQADIKRLFEEKVHELLGQQFIDKPSKTLAEEVVRRMLDGLANNDIPASLLQLYYKWADSAFYRPSLKSYVNNFRLSGVISPWDAHPDHCFNKLDVLALEQIASNSRDRSFVNDKLTKLNKRISSNRAALFVPDWWKDVQCLFEANTDSLSSIRNLAGFIDYYCTTFSKVDRAIRNLYVYFLSSGEIIRPLQEQYDGVNHLVLQIWFSFFTEYQSDQQGYLPKLIAAATTKTAVIVGDGIRYEIADFVATELQKHFVVDKQVMLADMPSETEHNMSALYVGGNEILPLQKDRETRLEQLTRQNIGFMQLEKLHPAVDQGILLLTYKDIDSAGEKLQQGAIKLFSEFETVLIDKITLLLNMGYAEVYLITDHGFVLTGLLDEGDKIEPYAKGKKEVHERFVRTIEKQTKDDWIEFKKPYGEFEYVYAAKNHRPFKSKGVYGFSHGGFTPQEIILPKFKFSRQKPASSSLDVVIVNKQELADVPSELFIIKLQAATSKDLFAAQRKVQIKLYARSKEYQSSAIVNMDGGNNESLEFSFNGNPDVQAVLLDAITQEQLDKVTVKKSNLRDLGGLL